MKILDFLSGKEVTKANLREFYASTSVKELLDADLRSIRETILMHKSNYLTAAITFQRTYRFDFNKSEVAGAFTLLLMHTTSPQWIAYPLTGAFVSRFYSLVAVFDSLKEDPIVTQ